MKKFVLPGLALVVIFALALLGWWLFGRERRVSVGSVSEPVAESAQTDVVGVERPAWVRR